MNETIEIASRGASPRVTVVVPALNEARNIPYVLADLPPEVHEVILVDGASIDGTVDVARRVCPDVRVVRQTRSGKGNALACGFAAARGDVIVMLDADGSADPNEIPRFVEALQAGADFAKGSRYVQGGGSDDLSRVRSLGNRTLNAMVNLFFGTTFTDLCYGYNAFWVHCLNAFELDTSSPPPRHGDGRLWGDGFEIETLLNVRTSAAGLRMIEVASFERRRIHGESNLRAVSDGLRVFRTILVERRRVLKARSRATSSVVQTLPGPGPEAQSSGSVADGSDA